MIRRSLTFTGSGQLADALGIEPERIAMIENRMNDMIDRNATIKQVLEYWNDRGDLTDSEWTAMVFALGVFNGEQS